MTINEIYEIFERTFNIGKDELGNKYKNSELKDKDFQISESNILKSDNSRIFNECRIINNKHEHTTFVRFYANNRINPNELMISLNEFHDHLGIKRVSDLEINEPIYYKQGYTTLYTLHKIKNDLCVDMVLIE